jgi:DNA-binding CsgD family transcriptional regulator
VTAGRAGASWRVTVEVPKTHINNAFAKIGARNRTEAAGYASRHGLGGPDQ